MTKLEGWLALTISIAVGGCSGSNDDTHARRGGSGPVETGGAPPASAPATNAPTPACPATMPSATMLAPNENVADLVLANESIWFRVDSAVFRLGKSGGAPAQVYKDKDDQLAHSFVDESGMLLVRSQDTNQTLLVRASLDGVAQQTIPEPSWEPTRTRVFASDAQWFYIATETQNGDALYKLGKTTGQLVMVAGFGTALQDSISDPQLAGTNVWFVRAKKRVYEVVQDAAGNIEAAPTGKDQGSSSPATEIFASGFQECRLAVGQSSTYCSDGKSLTRRALNGEDPQPIFDASKSAATAPLGAPFVAAGALWLRPVESAQGVIRSVKPNGASANETIVACGRGAIKDVAVDAKSVVWSEAKGIWIAPR